VESSRRLVLWDIDQTLIVTDGVAHEAYAAAIERTISQPWRGDLRFNGLTERAMAIRILRQHDTDPEPDLLAEFLVRIEEELHARAGLMAECGRALTGAEDALRAVAALDVMRQSVLTGNLQSVAALKLKVFGLDPWLDFSIGAYGDDDIERAALLPHSWRRAEALYGETYSAPATVLIGDTVRDVEAALAHGAAIVAVASGRTSADELADAGAVVVLEDLAGTGRVLDAIQEASVAAAK
jgi:phosphoglycolate phosphatase-like HAD superfamily hydrolase